jgi:hypothetical protein
LACQISAEKIILLKAQFKIGMLYVVKNNAPELNCTLLVVLLYCQHHIHRGLHSSSATDES